MLERARDRSDGARAVLGGIFTRVMVAMMLVLQVIAIVRHG